MVICILGRQPAIGLAELEALYGTDKVRPVGSSHAVVDAAVDFGRLGSVIKAAEYLATVKTIKPQKVFDYVGRVLPEYMSDFPEGKIKLGTSLYGLAMPLAKQNANALSLKKVVRTLGRSVRVVPNTDSALSSAQTYHNQLASPLGCEVIFVRDGNETLIGRVTHVQNINEYAERDRNRPKRDTKVGMLPPKLAQTIINLATGKLTDTSLDKCVLLDPFCGTGVILQEAGLMGYSVYGSDLDERMIRYSRDNINWLEARSATHIETHYELGDATDHVWRPPISVVASEAYLGTPFAQDPPEAALRDTITTCNLIMKKFLRNIHSQLAPGTRLCIAAPAWFVRRETRCLPLWTTITELGYRREKFTYASDEELIYHRDEQVVGRQLLVLVKM